ncbi:MAG TPA: hypothetical protein PK512_06375 [bacterium]|nr:hypothetical protein [bacterium]
MEGKEEMNKEEKIPEIAIDSQLQTADWLKRRKPDGSFMRDVWVKGGRITAQKEWEKDGFYLVDYNEPQPGIGEWAIFYYKINEDGSYKDWLVVSEKGCEKYYEEKGEKRYDDD